MVGLRTDASALFALCVLGVVFFLLAQQVQAFANIVTPNQVRGCGSPNKGSPSPRDGHRLSGRSTQARAVATAPNVM
jgi:hypothetical protein